MTMNEADWSKLKTDKGDARWVPDALAALAAPLTDDDGSPNSPRNRAFRGLSKRLFKNGKWLSAAPAVMKAVLALALKDNVPERHRLLALAAKLIALNPARYVVGGFDTAEAGVKKSRKCQKRPPYRAQQIRATTIATQCGGSYGHRSNEARTADSMAPTKVRQRRLPSLAAGASR